MGERWVGSPVNRNTVVPAVDDFIEDVKKVCATHGFSIQPGDPRGGLVIERLSGALDFDHLENADVGKTAAAGLLS